MPDLMNKYFGRGTESEGDRNLRAHREARADYVEKGLSLPMPWRHDPAFVLVIPPHTATRPDHPAVVRFGNNR